MHLFIFAMANCMGRSREGTRKIMSSCFTARAYAYEVLLGKKLHYDNVTKNSSLAVRSENRAICIATAVFQPRHVVRGNVPLFCIIANEDRRLHMFGRDKHDVIPFFVLVSQRGNYTAGAV